MQLLMTIDNVGVLRQPLATGSREKVFSKYSQAIYISHVSHRLAVPVNNIMGGSKATMVSV